VIAGNFELVARVVKARSGLVLTPDKLYMLETRLAPLLRREGLPTLDALAARLRDAPSGPLAEAVTEALTTNETSSATVRPSSICAACCPPWPRRGRRGRCCACGRPPARPGRRPTRSP
jgi:hypothetical protein